MRYRVYLKRGLGGPFEFEAKSKDEAAKMGLAEFRRNYGFVETVDLTPISERIDKVELIGV